MQKHLNKVFGLSVLVITLFASSAALAAEPNFSFENDDYKISYTRHPGYQEIAFSGSLMPMKAGNGLREVKKRLVKGLDTLLIIRGSSGGYEKSFRQLGEALRNVCEVGNQQSGCTFTTMSVSNCDSACILLFMYGQERVASSGAKFGFHRKWMIHPKLTIKTAVGMANQYVRLGADPDWLNENLNIFKDDQVNCTTIAAPNLIGSGIVHQIVSNVDYAAYKAAHGVYPAARY